MLREIDSPTEGDKVVGYLAFGESFLSNEYLENSIWSIIDAIWQSTA